MVALFIPPRCRIPSETGGLSSNGELQHAVGMMRVYYNVTSIATILWKFNEHVQFFPRLIYRGRSQKFIDSPDACMIPE